MKNIGVRYGLLGGIVVVFYFALLYVIQPKYFLSPFLQWGSMVFYLFFMWQAAKEDCARSGTQRDFRELIRTPFITFLLINLCYWLFYYGLHLYDQGLLQAELEMKLNWEKSKVAAGLGDPEQANKAREAIQELEKLVQSPQPQPLAPILTQMCMGAVGGFGLAAAIAALVRTQKKPAPNQP